MSQLQNVRSKFADNRKWPDCKSRSSQGVEKTLFCKTRKWKVLGRTRKRGGDLNYNWSKESRGREVK